jgi:hypothetical protein
MNDRDIREKEKEYNYTSDSYERLKIEREMKKHGYEKVQEFGKWTFKEKGKIKEENTKPYEGEGLPIGDFGANLNLILTIIVFFIRWIFPPFMIKATFEQYQHYIKDVLPGLASSEKIALYKLSTLAIDGGFIFLSIFIMFYKFKYSKLRKIFGIIAYLSSIFFFGFELYQNFAFKGSIILGIITILISGIFVFSKKKSFIKGLVLIGCALLGNFFYALEISNVWLSLFVSGLLLLTSFQQNNAE